MKCKVKKHDRRRPLGSVVTVVLAAGLAFLGCVNQAPKVTAETLFSLSVGPLEDQVQVAPGYDQAGVFISLTEGLFHVVNAPVRKVMRFSSFGDLLLLLYDPSLNPEPVGLAERGPRRARSRLLGDLGRIAADSQGTIYVQERLPAGSEQTDDAVTRAHIVRRFDPTGADQGYLGREGMEGTPLGFVHRLVVTDQDDLVVVTREVGVWEVFWFDAQGLLKFRRRIVVEELSRSGSDLRLNEITAVIADPTGPPQLLIETIVQTEGRSEIWQLDGDGIPSHVFTVPISPYSPFRLIGSALGRLFFVSYSRGEGTGSYGAAVAITDQEGQSLAQFELSLRDSGLQLTDLQVAADGVLYGAHIGPERVEVFWWRTDRLIQRR